MFYDTNRMRRHKRARELSVEEFIELHPPRRVKPEKEKNPQKLDGMEVVIPGDGEESIIMLPQCTEADTPKLIVHSPKMQRIAKLIERVAPTDETVLITGETGTGKGLLAREIHERSLRRRKEFVIVDCTSLSEHLIESELFGHERGAFTGATMLKKGLCEFADGGTLFLDEISELPHGMQSRLLHVLEERQIRRVGGLKYYSVDIRVIVATNQKLDELVAQRKFRSDLFYRLNVLEIMVPPLRDRPEDIQVLVEHFRRELKEQPDFPPDILKVLGLYKWPGNVRELRNLVHRCSVLSADTVSVLNLPEHFAPILAIA